MRTRFSIIFSARNIREVNRTRRFAFTCNANVSANAWFVIVGVLGRVGKGGKVDGWREGGREGGREDRKGELKAPGLPICHTLFLSLSQSEEGRKGAANGDGERG